MKPVKISALATALTVAVVLFSGCGGTHTGNPSDVAETCPELQTGAVTAFRLMRPGDEWHIESYLTANPLLKRAEQVIERSDTLIGNVLYIVVPLSDTVYRADTTFVNEIIIDTCTALDTVDSIDGADTITAVFSVLKTDSVVIVDTLVSVDTIIYSDTIFIRDTIVIGDSTADTGADSANWDVQSADIILLDGTVEERSAPQYIMVSYDQSAGANYEYAGQAAPESLILVPVDEENFSVLSIENLVGVQSMLLRTVDSDGPMVVSYGLDPESAVQDTMVLGITRVTGYGDIANSSVTYRIARDMSDPSGRSDRLAAISATRTYQTGDIRELSLQIRLDTPCAKSEQPQSGAISMTIETADGDIGTLIEGEIDTKVGLLYGVYRKGNSEYPVILDSDGGLVDINIDITGKSLP